MLEISILARGRAHAPPPAIENLPPRGVPPRILLEQVRNTVPYLLEDSFAPQLPFVRWLREANRVLKITPEADFSHEEYFALCVAAHFGTVASFVPTDVDNQIRFRLWSPVLPADMIESMARLVLEARQWDVSPVTTRGVSHPEVPGLLSGHDGEWFSIAVAAYAALRRRSPELCEEVFSAIVKEIDREARMLQAFRADRNGIGLLKCATIIAHNLGDLDRVMDMWNFQPEDPLHALAYKSGHDDSSRWQGALVYAGELNKAMMADENHRHFALRGPRCLRRSPDLLIPIGPFFDDWGRCLARHPELSREEVAEVAEALVDGWTWFSEQKGGGPNVPVGYARALSGIIENFAGGLNGLANELPARVARQLKTGVLRSQCAVPRAQFEEKWSRKALNHAARSQN